MLKLGLHLLLGFEIFALTILDLDKIQKEIQIDLG